MCVAERFWRKRVDLGAARPGEEDIIELSEVGPEIELQWFWYYITMLISLQSFRLFLGKKDQIPKYIISEAFRSDVNSLGT